MNIAIRFHTRSGNTKKLAEAVAGAVAAPAIDVTVPLTEKADILFLGSSYYAFDVDDAVKEFLKNNKNNIKKIVCFGTSAMMKSMKKPITKIAKELGMTVAEEEFHCRGSFGPMHRGRPNEKDLQKIADFAKNIVKGEYKHE